MGHWITEYKASPSVLISSLGRGMAYPCQEGTAQHGAQVAQGYVRVQVDMVHDNLRAVPLEIRPNDEIRTLGDVVYSFIQWPKKDIALDPAVPPQPSIQNASPTGPSMTPPQPSRLARYGSSCETTREPIRRHTFLVPSASSPREPMRRTSEAKVEVESL